MRFWLRSGAAVLAVVVAGSSAKAINIVPVFNNTDNETPIFDLFNEGIQDLMDYAEVYYQDIIEDPGYTLTLNFWYEDLQDNYLGLYNTVSTSGGRVTEGNIRIDTREGNGGDYRDWYIDPTPSNDSEFEMGKILFDDLTGLQKSDYIDWVDAPEALEVGYRGSAVGGGPVPFGSYDMLSTILHEVGHALGIRSGAAESNDGDYDINPVFNFGPAMAAEIDTDSDGPDPGHMKPGTLLMCGGCGSANVRRRPSHFDIYAMATSLGFTQIDVPRREFLGGGVWGVNGNWSGNRTPDGNDEAFMRSAGLVVMNAGDTVSGLTVVDTTDLVTGANTLTVNGTLTMINTFSNTRAAVVVGAGGQVNADDVVVEKNSELAMAGGVANIDDDLFTGERGLCCENDGAVTGHGTVNVGDLFSNEGEVRPSGGTLIINAARFDLDGVDGGLNQPKIDATLGSIEFNGAHDDAFDREIEIGFAQLVTFSDPWELGVTGELMITDGGLINQGHWQANGVVQIDHTVPFGVVGVGGTGTMTVGTTGQVTTSGVVDFVSPSVLDGSLHVTTEAVRFSAGGVFSSSAAVTLDVGTGLHLIFEEDYVIEDGATFTGTGVLFVGQLATLTLDDELALGVPLVNEGRLELGASPGQVDMLADFLQTATGVAAFEIGSFKPSAFDSIDLAGQTAFLDGVLELSLINGYAPSVGTTFTIIEAGSISGTFDSVIDLSGGMIFDVIYNPTSVVVHTVGLLGDLNGDGFVGIDDLNIVLANWNQNVPPGDPLADSNGDGFVGIDDLNAVLGNWNAGTPPTDIANIPEPGTVGLVAVLCGAGVSRRRERS